MMMVKLQLYFHHIFRMFIFKPPAYELSASQEYVSYLFGV